MGGGTVNTERDVDINFGEEDGVIIGEGGSNGNDKNESGKDGSKADTGGGLQNS